MNNLVLRENHEGAAILTLNRPERLNALSKDMVAALEAHVESLERETKTIGLVILRGAAGNFSSGHDMNEVASQVKAHAKPHYYVEVIDKVANLPQPVIAAVQGHCSTGALELALAADLIVAAASACFTDAYARWGLTPIWGLSLRLPHRIGTSKAGEMMYTCRTYSGAEAFEMHLANYCFADEQFEAELERLARDILANSWYSNQVDKRALLESDGLTLREAHGLNMFKNEGLAPDAAQRVARFFKKHKKGS
jgi:enoyl-CoA hydratase